MKKLIYFIAGILAILFFVATGLLAVDVSYGNIAGKAESPLFGISTEFSVIFILVCYCLTCGIVAISLLQEET